MKQTTGPIINIIERQASRCPSRIDIHEHRAPTDQSVALLKEMEERALAKIIEAVRLDGNGFECEIHRYKELTTLSDVFVAIFDLNGKRMVAKITRHDHLEIRDVLPEIRDEIAKMIATEALSQAFVPEQLGFSKLR